MKSITVFCGSSTGFNPVYGQAARAFGQHLAQRQIALVYGGASVGLMGIVADTVLAQAGRVIGVIPEAMQKIEIAHRSLSELCVVDTMHQRKALMADRADAFVLLPGGAGSLDEFFEVFTWLQLGYHRKPCGILNVNGYYDGLLAWIDHAIAEGFMKPAHRDAIICETEIEPLLDRLAAFVPTLPGKWVKN